jgi:hypothetical protein
METGTGRTYGLSQIPDLYQELAGHWLLLEVLASDEKNQPSRVRLIAESSDKAELHDYVMDHGSWSVEHRYLMVKADPTKPCTIKTSNSDTWKT